MKVILIRALRSFLRRTFKLCGDKFYLDPTSWKIIRCRFDGTDYIHTWSGGALVWFEPTSQARHITSEDLPLFLNHTKINSGDTVLIAGAGMGSELWYFSQKIGPTGILLAIEPDEDAFRRLSKLVELLPFKNVKLFKCAVSSKAGSAQLYSSDSKTVSNTMVESNISNLKSQTIEVYTIENLCKSLDITFVDYLKMNIEGAEFSALIGVGEIVVGHFCISCHDFLGEEFKTKKQIISELSRRNYRIWESEEDDSRPWVGSYVYAKIPLVH